MGYVETSRLVLGENPAASIILDRNNQMLSSFRELFEKIC